MFMFTAEERQIYRTKIDGADACFDPMVIERRLKAALDGKDIGEVFKKIEHESPAVHDPALTELASIAYATFDGHPLGRDGSGMTETEVLESLYGYFRWDSEQKKTADNSPSGSESTAGPPGESAPSEGSTISPTGNSG